MPELSDTKFVHCVYFWLKDDLTPDQIKELERGLERLAHIETVKKGYIGVPATTDRPIIDRTYDYALILAFDNKEQHDIYQEHPVHEEFRQAFGTFWLKVTIYDVV